ncbi:hypothetical protein KPH14_001947 [Odynerus spinipes]|uniref:Uncharacterized protein n=1 Tax=Odynerus spinipes TaxID=1348599 RepID=A0AAD9S058_9HYME|nr:hypothetical protein KPH14_001947 [Odynerus spinipes]
MKISSVKFSPYQFLPSLANSTQGLTTCTTNDCFQFSKIPELEVPICVKCKKCEGRLPTNSRLIASGQSARSKKRDRGSGEHLVSHKIQSMESQEWNA